VRAEVIPHLRRGRREQRVGDAWRAETGRAYREPFY